MSSQGPASGTAGVTGATGCFGNTQNSQVPPVYEFSTTSIRDGSDWIAYKKQLLIRNETKSKITQNQWAQFGNDYRLQYKLGVYKEGTTGCSSCPSNAFGGTGPF